MSDGCCCGATKSNPCICMKKGITKCSKSEPKCPCYAEKDKKSFEKAWPVVKSNARNHNFSYNPQKKRFQSERICRFCDDPTGFSSWTEADICQGCV